MSSRKYYGIKKFFDREEIEYEEKYQKYLKIHRFEMEFSEEFKEDFKNDDNIVNPYALINGNPQSVYKFYDYDDYDYYDQLEREKRDYLSLVNDNFLIKNYKLLKEIFNKYLKIDNENKTLTIYEFFIKDTLVCYLENIFEEILLIDEKFNVSLQHIDLEDTKEILWESEDTYHEVLEKKLLIIKHEDIRMLNLISEYLLDKINKIEVIIFDNQRVEDNIFLANKRDVYQTFRKETGFSSPYSPNLFNFEEDIYLRYRELVLKEKMENQKTKHISYKKLKI